VNGMETRQEDREDSKSPSTAGKSMWIHFFVLLFAFPTTTFGVVTYFVNQLFLRSDIPTGDTIIFVAFFGVLAWISGQILYDKRESLPSRGKWFVFLFLAMNSLSGIFVWYYLILQAALAS
jgi:hypothetical protein